MASATEITQFVDWASAWARTAGAAELWEVLHCGKIGQRIGMPTTMPGLGILSGPHGDVEDELRCRSWGPGDDVRDLEDWFLSNPAAQSGARQELQEELLELFVDLGDWDPEENHVHTLHLARGP